MAGDSSFGIPDPKGFRELHFLSFLQIQIEIALSSIDHRVTLLQVVSTISTDRGTLILFLGNCVSQPSSVKMIFHYSHIYKDCRIICSANPQSQPRGNVHTCIMSTARHKAPDTQDRIIITTGLRYKSKIM